LGGVIDVATSVGKGSTFTVYLPRAGNVARAGKLEKRAEPGARRGAHERILVVDDEAPLVKLVTENLTEFGYTTVGFTASAAALAAFLADPFQFDAVITDESMPGTSGAELIRQMRAVRPTMPVLLVSGYLSAAVVQRAMEAGATEVLKKPLPAGQLAAALDRVLHARRAPQADEIGPVPPGKRMPPQSRRPRTSPSRARSTRRR
jgi:DNA-binding NtrC family response regulator